MQIFRSFDAGDDSPVSDGDEVVCDERNLVDLLTLNDTHVYDLRDANFTKNIGEAEDVSGESTSIDADDTKGFVIITPVVSESDFTAISFQHLIGSTRDDGGSIEYGINAMGRDAVDFTTGEIVADGTPLDVETSGFQVLRPEELLFDFSASVSADGTGGRADVIGIAFQDEYGPSGLLGYKVVPGR